ncbi:glycosyltransferase family 2 protein [Allopontixanthobacter sp.]|uniref:glycosyltransferase family 2 protein n=1 Tax=Allopontixanthobacter sp. TaxID=2906452 RepID=UPI002ABA2B95|nr:glycosyltransferase family 2 protein [Allopontixanthobacter sp.]MDZ4307478.1 glycosyltransferase family 2 protein [Allopontixanthobacter sp.]
MVFSNAPPLVSVICIFYNAEQFLREAIDSVLAQSCSNYELILVDDGSSDGSTDIARQYSRDYRHVFYADHPGHENLGMSAARSRGLAEARGEFVACIDADDVWRPEKLARQIAILEQSPRVGMVCGTVNYWSSWNGGQDELIPTGHLVDEVSLPPDTSLALYPLGEAAAPCPSDAMLRRRVIDAVGGPEQHFTGMYEDQCLYAKVYLETPVYFASEVWLDYRQHADSCVSTSTLGGLYAPAARYWMDWFSGYLAARHFEGKADVERALRRARWRLDHPRLRRVVKLLRRAAR